MIKILENRINELEHIETSNQSTQTIDGEIDDAVNKSIITENKTSTILKSIDFDLNENKSEKSSSNENNIIDINNNIELNEIDIKNENDIISSVDVDVDVDDVVKDRFNFRDISELVKQLTERQIASEKFLANFIRDNTCDDVEKKFNI